MKGRDVNRDSMLTWSSVEPSVCAVAVRPTNDVRLPSSRNAVGVGSERFHLQVEGASYAAGVNGRAVHAASSRTALAKSSRRARM
jgi:hypothetical protein